MQESHGNLSSPGSVIIGTRGSALARWQAAEVGRLLAGRASRAAGQREDRRHAGDRVQTGPVIDLGGKGVWVKEIERACSRATSTSPCTA
jgi:porphobilinogen deaminase